jgi:anti-anti-sigma factor
MKLNLENIDPAGVAHVAIAGDITIRDFANPGKNPLETVLGSDWASHRVMLSLEHVTFIDSSAIGWLFDCHRKFKEKGGKIIWFNPSPRVKDMLELLKMAQSLNIRATEAEAEAALR